MAIHRTTIALALAGALACSSFSFAGDAPKKRFRSADGLERIYDAPVPGILEVRENHGIGGYDALLVPDATLRHRRESDRLTIQARRIFLSLLREELVDAASAARIPIMSQPGLCTMTIELSVVGLDISVAGDKDGLADMTVVMQFEDSESGETLLRYALESRIANPADDEDQHQALKKGLREVIEDMNLANALRGAGLADDAIRPGCKGTFAALGRAAQRARQGLKAD